MLLYAAGLGTKIVQRHLDSEGMSAFAQKEELINMLGQSAPLCCDDVSGRREDFLLRR